MKKYFCFTATYTFLVMTLVTGCKRQPATGPGASAANPQSPPGYFQTPFQEESQFIVETVVSDLAEQMFYAANHRLPDTNYFQVVATEKSGSPRDTPVYELQIQLDPKQGVINSELNVNGPIWSPAIYQNVAEDLAKSVGLAAANKDESQDTSLLSKLTDNSPVTIEQENQQLSSELENDFTNPELHEKAAALLGAFLLRDHSGHFFEIRSPLCRMTAHLTMAQFLNGSRPYGVNGQMAEAILFTLLNDQSLALEKLNAVGTNDATVAPIVRALWTRNTGDYRLLGQMNNLSSIESVEEFCAMADYVDPDLAWPKLNAIEQRTIDYVRVANEQDYSVEMGHQLLEVSIPLELHEIQNVYQLSHTNQLTRATLINSLNEMPDRCFTAAPDGTVHVHVIGWGQWADFLQRHLCHAIQQNFYFMQDRWGVPDNAKDFASKCDLEFSGLRLYPFVERFDCTDTNSYHQAEDDGFKVTVASPQLVPAECWNWLCYTVDFAPLYVPSSNPHVNEWHYHNPPPGTDYDLNPRLDHPSLTERPDAVACFEKLHELAPYDCRVINFILEHKYNNHPTYDQAMSLYQNLLPYSLTAMKRVANTAYKQPEQYRKLMLQAAQLSPTCYYDLADFEIRQTNNDEAARYLEKACDADPDSVQVSNHSRWRVRYYLNKGDTEKAKEVADFAGEVYSFDGLEAEGMFYEGTSNYDNAFNWYQKIEDRYNDSTPVISFCIHYKTHTGDARFDSEVQKRLDKLFPKGIEKVSLADFRGPPSDGVIIGQQNDRVLSAGLKKGDVVVALGGTRTHTFLQYSYIRNSQTDPELDLIVWRDNIYHEISASPPHRLFGVPFDDYRRR